MVAAKRFRRPEEYVIQAMFDAQFGRCFYCGTPLVIGRKNHTHRRYATIEHIKPRVECERHEVGSEGNIVLACRRCNDEKDHMPVICFLLRLNQSPHA